MVSWSDEEMEPAYWYILNNCDEVEPFKIQHYELLKRESPFKLEERQRDQFPKWFKGHIEELYSQGSSHVTEEMYALSFGPSDTVGTYTMCNANGVRWHVKQLQQTKTVQNSGIMVPGSHNNGESDFYGQLVSVVKLDFPYGYSVFLFKCEWFNTVNTRKRKRIFYDYHLTSLNVNDKWYVKDSFVLAKQAQQVFYLDDPNLGFGWKVIQKIRHRHIWDVPENEESHDAETNYVDGIDQEDEASNIIPPIEDDNVELMSSLRRNDVEPELVVLTNKDIEQGTLIGDDFIDDNLLDEELPSGDEDDTQESDEYSDLD